MKNNMKNDTPLSWRRPSGRVFPIIDSAGKLLNGDDLAMTTDTRDNMFSPFFPDLTWDDELANLLESTVVPGIPDPVESCFRAIEEMTMLSTDRNKIVDQLRHTIDLFEEAVSVAAGRSAAKGQPHTVRTPFGLMSRLGLREMTDRLTRLATEIVTETASAEARNETPDPWKKSTPRYFSDGRIAPPPIFPPLETMGSRGIDRAFSFDSSWLSRNSGLLPGVTSSRLPSRYTPHVEPSQPTPVNSARDLSKKLDAMNLASEQDAELYEEWQREKYADAEEDEQPGAATSGENKSPRSEIWSDFDAYKKMHVEPEHQKKMDVMLADLEIRMPVGKKNRQQAAREKADREQPEREKPEFDLGNKQKSPAHLEKTRARRNMFNKARIADREWEVVDADDDWEVVEDEGKKGVEDYLKK